MWATLLSSPQEGKGQLQRDTIQKSNLAQALPGPQSHIYELKISGEDECLRPFLLQQVLIDEHIIYVTNWDTFESVKW